MLCLHLLLLVPVPRSRVYSWQLAAAAHSVMAAAIAALVVLLAMMTLRVARASILSLVDEIAHSYV